MNTTTTTTQRSATSRTRKGGTWKKVIPWAIGIGLLVAIVSGLRPRPLQVETATIENGPLTVSVLEEGKTRIRHRYIISPPIAGFLNRIPLRAGERIEAGKTVLATIQPQQAAFLDPRSRAEAQARLKGTEAAKLQRETQVERARMALDLAEKEMGRMKTLRNTGAVAAREWDIAENQASLLGRELRAAEFALQVAEFERAQAEAALVQTDSPGGTASKPIEIVAPVNGYVLNVHEESARTVAAGTPLMEVGDPADIEAEIELLSSDAVGVRVGAEVSIEQWGGDQPLRGRVSLVEPGGFTKVSALGVEEQRVKVRVEFVDPLPAGISFGDRYRVEARITTWRADSVPRVPTGALFRKGNDWMVFAIEGGKARAAKLDIAHQNGAFAEVRGGLATGATVILHPPDSLVEGAMVEAKQASKP